MIRSSCVWAVVALLFSLPLAAQKTTVYTEANLAFKRGEDFFNKGVYGYAMEEYADAMRLLLPAHEPSWELLSMRAELGYAKSAVRMGLPEGENLILDFIRKYKPDPLASQALLEVANYFFNARKYEQANEFFSQISPRDLAPAQMAEVNFKMGYGYFVQKKFDRAEAKFKEVKDIPTDYFYPSNYYYGLCKFFKGHYNEAIRSFRLVERSNDYKPHVPYYISQIYFAQRDFDQLIQYAEPKLDDRRIRNTRQMTQLVGQAWFEKGDYEKALPYLEEYAQTSGRMREEEFYQLGYCQYKMGKYESAARNFQELTSVESLLGQSALYYLADCRLRAGDKQAARSAFLAASRMSFDPEMQENALFNYGKLSHELRFDKEALVALQSIPPSSQHYSEAQELMSDIFLNTRNYAQAIAVLESMPDRTPKLREAYQKVLYLRGVQLMKSGNEAAAADLFSKSISNSVESEYKALALYWLGDIAYHKNQYDQSINYINQFLALGKTLSSLPEESSVFTANYIQGYNYLKKKNFNTAASYFTEAVNGIRRNRAFITSKTVKETILGDATLRAGDCNFKLNRYTDALSFYETAVRSRYPNFEYALYQKAIILGLRGRNTEKLVALEDLVNKYPRSEYADDALFQLGLTYMEMRQFNPAISAYQRLVADYPNSDLVNSALLRLGLAAYNAANVQGAIDYYKRVFAHNPTPAEADAALSALRQIYVNDLADPDAYASFLETVPGYKLDNLGKDTLAFETAEKAYERGQYERAVTSFTDYINKYPQGVNILPAHYHRGESYAVLKQYSPALRDYEWIIAKGEGRYYVDALKKAAAIAYHNEQNFAKAYEYYTKLETVSTSSSDRFEAQLGAMRSAYRLGDVAAVQSAARKVATNPAANSQQVATAQFYIGKIAMDSKDYASAMESFREVIKLTDDESAAEAHYLIAKIHYLNRDLDKAKDKCMANNTEANDYPYWVARSLLLLADVFAEQNDFFSAKTVLEALIENYENTEDDILPEARRKLEVLNRQLNEGSRLDRDSGNNFMENDPNGNGN